MSSRPLGFLREYRAALLILPVVLLLLVFFVYPLLEVLRTSLFDPSFTTEHVGRFFDKPVYLTVFYRTLRVSLVVTLGCFLIGYPAAYFLTRVGPQVRIYLIFLILLPFWTSLLIRTYSWIAVLGRQGVLNSILVETGLVAEPVRMLYTTGAVYLAMIQILLPIMILTCYSVMADIDKDLIRAARVLGASPFRAFLRVFFPLSLSGATTGAIIIFILSMGFFVTPVVLGGGRIIMVSMRITDNIELFFNWGAASALGVVLLVLTLIILYVASRLLRFDQMLGGGHGS